MPNLRTSWLVGSYFIPGGLSVTIDGTPSTWSAADQGYYLYSSTSALSMLSKFKALLDAAVGVPTLVQVRRDRKVQLNSPGGNFTVAWTSTLLRDLLGFSQGNLSGDDTYVASSISPLLWSPLKNENPQDAPLGVLGRPVGDDVFLTAPDGTTVVTSHYTQVMNSFAWQMVPSDRYQTDDALGGEYLTFWDYCLRKGYKFRLWREILESTESSSTAVTWTEDLGPYVLRPGRGPLTVPFKRSAGLTWTDARYDVELDCLVCPEWDT